MRDKHKMKLKDLSLSNRSRSWNIGNLKLKSSTRELKVKKFRGIELLNGVIVFFIFKERIQPFT